MPDTPAHWPIAQVNIARMRAPEGDPIMADFFAALDEVNAMAEAAPGFIWRLKGEDNNATALRVFDDMMLIINMSVWESIDALYQFTYYSGHAEAYRRRAEWFSRLENPGVALWWLPAGAPMPTPAAARARLEWMAVHGPTPLAFTFRRRFTPAEWAAYVPAAYVPAATMPAVDEPAPAAVDGMGVHHLAVVVADLDRALSFWRDALGLHAEPTEHNAAEGVDLAFLPVGGGAVELIAPAAGEDSTGVARYLAKTGGGLHHLCLEVPDLDAAAERLRAHGAELTSDAPRTRPDGRRYLFVHPRSTGGVLLELYGPAPTSDQHLKEVHKPTQEHAR